MHRTALVLVIFAIVFPTLAIVSYTRKSATWDEPQHLAAGVLALRDDDYRLDPEHPPLLRMWAALPVTRAHMEPALIDGENPTDWVAVVQFYFAHKFMYQVNDADRMLYRARFMVVVLGVLLGGLLFCWVKEWLGFWPATMTLACYCLEPNLQAHASLVTTDFGVTVFMFATLYFLWRTCRTWSAGNVGGMTIFFALAIVSKFSALVLGPVVLALLLVHLRRLKWHRVAGAVVLLTAVSWFAVWAVYGFRYAPSRNPTWLFHFDQQAEAKENTPAVARLVGWTDSHRLLPNAFSQGFLLGRMKAQKHSAFFAGRHSTTGWWYFFPAAFAIKTPVALLLLMAGGTALCWRRWRREALFIGLPVVFYVGVAMTQPLNIGLRHILPVYPLLLLLVAIGVAELLKRPPAVLVLIGVLGVAEFARAYPDNLAFFNLFVGGPRNGYRYLVDSNLDWGQDLKGLKVWMDRNDVKHIALSYFGTADPAYYGIQCTHLPGTAFYLENAVTAPQLPGYVAVSATCLQGAYLSEAGRSFYLPLLEREPVARVGNSIFVYRVEQPWWP